MKRDQDILSKRLLGEFISRFSVGDTWDMYIGDYNLSAHTIEFEQENQIAEFLKGHYEEYNYSVDKEDISRSTIMAANLRKPITKISLDELKNLRIDFEHGSTMKILTNTEIVDWQWCLNKSGKDPYIDYEIACFWAGETQIKE
jgi:hypothetical protein